MNYSILNHDNKSSADCDKDIRIGPSFKPNIADESIFSDQPFNQDLELNLIKNFDLKLLSQEAQKESIGPFAKSQSSKFLKGQNNSSKFASGWEATRESEKRGQLVKEIGEFPKEKSLDPSSPIVGSLNSISISNSSETSMASEVQEGERMKKKKLKEKDRIPQCGNQSFEEHRWEFYQAEKMVQQEVEFTWNLGKAIGLESEATEDEIKKNLGDLVKQDVKGGHSKGVSKKRRNRKVI